jgi:hypothetical protein
MPADGIGSSVILALAAVLWLAYLVPSWLRRREYLSTERNALRLQRTLRVLAESAEVPAEVRAESTARGVLQQERALRKKLRREAALAKAQEKARDAALARAAARRPAAAAIARPAPARPVTPRTALAAELSPASAASRRLRRSRALTSLVLLSSLISGGFGIELLLSSGAWMLLGSSAAVAVVSFVMLGQMAAVSKARAESARPPVAPPSVAERVEVPSRAAVRHESWTPVPVPKPLYLSRPAVARAVDASLQAAAELRQAAADAERKLREAQDAPEVRPLRRAVPSPAAAASQPSRFAGMGIVDPGETGTPDLDAALARRRA